MATPPPLPSRNPSGTMRGASERMPTLPERVSPASSDRMVGNEDQLGLEPNAQVGVWYDVMSTWLSRVRFAWTSTARGGPPTPTTSDPKSRTGYLSVEFLSGATVEYNNPLSYSVFDDLINSSSKGSYIWHASPGLIRQPYTLLSPAIRRVTSEMRKLRAPKTGGRGQRLIGAKRRPPTIPSVH